MALESIDLSNLGQRLGLENVTVSLAGPSEAVALSTDDLVDLEGSEDAPILVMSTGLAADVTNENIAGDQGTDLGLEGGVDDDIVLTFDIVKEEADNFFSFDFTFLTEEFPEFVGADFNDFFSATVNGIEVAIDLNGDPIDVNNNFFDPDLSTDGTQFDGRTTTLRVTAPIDVDQINTTVEFRVADEGDGRFDSAVFVNNLNLSANTIFIDFGGLDDVVFDTTVEDDLTFALPASGLTGDEIDQIMNGVPNEDDDNIDDDEDIFGVRDIFDGFAIDFVTERPDFDDFATIHVGGAFADLPALLQSDETVISFSEAIDPGNQTNVDQAVVLSQEIVEITDANAKIGLLAQTIAREAAHLVGLRNVEDREAVVFPTPGESRVELTATSAIASLADDGSITVTDVLQDIPNELANSVGIIGPAPVPTTSLAEALTKVVTIEAVDGAAAIFDVRAIVVDADDNILALQDIGDLAGNGVLNFVASATDADRVVLIAKSVDGGAFDLILSSRDTEAFSFIGATQGEIIDQLGVPVADFEAGVFSFTGVDGAATPAPAVEISTSVTGQPVEVGDALANSLQTEGTGGSLFGLGGDDVLTGGAGVDGLFGGAGADTASGGAGDDVLRGGDGDDSLTGGDDDDLISGGAGADILNGEGGNDTLVATLGDVVDGGIGVDILQTEIAFADTTLSDGDPGFVFTTADGVLTTTGVEEFQFSDQTLTAAQLTAILTPDTPDDVDGDQGDLDDDGGVIEGGEADDTLNGGAGDDDIRGNGGDDLIASGAGDDEVTGGQGDDTIRGQSGDDNLNGGAGDDSVLGGAGADELTGRGGADTLKGGGGGDVLIGGFGEDRLSGGGGSDDLNGGAGADIVRGGGGNDSLRGGGGDDALNGGGGDDVLNGGRGNDVLRGGSGEDIFQFKSGDGADRIRDFQQGADKIEILRGAEDFSDLNITQSGANTNISFANVTVIVERRDVGGFDEDDFIF